MPSLKQLRGHRAERWVADLVASKTPLVRRLDLERKLKRGPHRVQIDLIFSLASTLYFVEVKSGFVWSNPRIVARSQLQRQSHLVNALELGSAQVRWFLALVDLSTGAVVFLENPC